MKKKNYESPSIKIIEAEVEEGFAASDVNTIINAMGTEEMVEDEGEWEI